MSILQREEAGMNMEEIILYTTEDGGGAGVRLKKEGQA